MGDFVAEEGNAFVIVKARPERQAHPKPRPLAQAEPECPRIPFGGDPDRVDTRGMEGCGDLIDQTVELGRLGPSERRSRGLRETRPRDHADRRHDHADPEQDQVVAEHDQPQPEQEDRDRYRINGKRNRVGGQSADGEPRPDDRRRQQLPIQGIAGAIGDRLPDHVDPVRRIGRSHTCVHVPAARRAPRNERPVVRDPCPAVRTVPLADGSLDPDALDLGHRSAFRSLAFPSPIVTTGPGPPSPRRGRACARRSAGSGTGRSRRRPTGPGR